MAIIMALMILLAIIMTIGMTEKTCGRHKMAGKREKKECQKQKEK